MGKASRKRQNAAQMRCAFVQRADGTAEAESESKNRRDVKNQAGTGESLESQDFRPVEQVGNTAEVYVLDGRFCSPTCTAPECTRNLCLLALMRRLGLGPEQELWRGKVQPTWGMGAICNCHDVRVTALQKAAEQVIHGNGYNCVADIPHEQWFEGPHTGMWNDVKKVAKRLLKHKRMCKRKQEKKKGLSALI